MNAPPKFLLFLEIIRSIMEYGQSLMLNLPLRFISPKGDGHPVIIFPGLGSSDVSTRILRKFLEDIGYTVYPWGLGRNHGPKNGLSELMESLEARIREVSANHNGEKVTIIGWSLGGIYAREVAKLVPDITRQVITLGTPFKNISSSTNAKFLYELLSKSKYDTALFESISERPPVLFTSIYSKTDGVVAWSSSIEEVTDASENIEVPFVSHLGMGHNPIVLHVVANRLAQSPQAWQHYNT